MRPVKDEYYLGLAEAVLKRSTCLRRQYGAVIVKNDEVISTGYNGSPRGMENCLDKGVCTRESLNVPKGQRYELCCSVHAEQNAIIRASREQMLDSTLYIVGREVETGGYADPTPCVICSRMIRNAGIKEVVGRAKDGSIIKIDTSDLNIN